MAGAKTGKPGGGGGRPSKRTPEVVTKILEQLGDGIPMAEICRQPGMPRLSTVYDWMGVDAELAGKIARARDDGFERIAVDALRIANTPEIGEIEIDKGNGIVEVRRADMIEHRKLQIHTRLQLLAKWNPKKYGDRTVLAGDADNPLQQVSRIEIAFVGGATNPHVTQERDAEDDTDQDA